MATITSFEGLSMPGKTELRQFAELFEPLYQNSSQQARRLAVAALSQCKVLPRAIVHFIGCQPIDIAATFLTASPALDDDALIAIARSQGPAHVKAIAARRDLSVKVVDALVSIRQDNAGQLQEENIRQAELASAEIFTLPDRRLDERGLAEELLRQQLKTLVMRVEADPASQTQATVDTQQALMVRFARERQARQFSSVLAGALESSPWLAERILLDLSGQQLATTLLALGLSHQDCEFILMQFYGHLSHQAKGESRARGILNALDPEACVARVQSWLRADACIWELPDMDVETPANQDLAGPSIAATARPAFNFHRAS